MKFLKRLIWTLLPIFGLMPIFFIVLTLFPDRYVAASPKGRKVFVGKVDDRYVLYRNGQPFFIQGASGSTFLKELHEAGGNTIRVYDTLQLASVLDDAQRNNIAVIVGLPMPASAYRDYYRNNENVEAMYKAFFNTVVRYKDHPALLMWCLGNELGMTWKPGHDAFYNAYNRLLDMIHEADPDHPVTTTMPNFNIAQVLMIKYRVPGLDIISFNTFGKLKFLNTQLQRYAPLWNGPFLVMEWGAYGPWESETTAWNVPVENTSTQKAEHYFHMYTTQMPLTHPRFLGSMVFFWGQKQEITPTWFSTFSATGAATEAVHVLKQLWRKTAPDMDVPRLKYMLVNGEGTRDNLFFTPRSVQAAEYVMEADNKADIASVQWQIMKEDWYEDLKRKRPPVILLDTMTSAASGNRLLFTTPMQEGPYRIYVKIADGHGNEATANTPFYVVN